MPPAARGSSQAGLIELSDWYSTFCALAGVSPNDPVAEAAGLFPPDGLNMWPLLSGANSTPPREYVMLGSTDADPQSGNTIVQGVVRADGYKLLLGKVANNWWTGPVYPNASTYPTGNYDCGNKGCLFNVFTDPSEYNDVAAENPDIVKELAKVISEYKVYNPDRGANDGEACKKAFSVHKGCEFDTGALPRTASPPSHTHTHTHYPRARAPLR